MTAGEPAAALLELRDGVGRRALHGGVQVEATLVPSADAAGRSGPAAAGVRAAAGPGAQRGAATGTGAQRDNPAGTAGRASGPSACKASAAARDEPGAVPEVAVVDRGNGLYELRFTLTRAGAWALVARLATGSGGGGGGGGGGGRGRARVAVWAGGGRGDAAGRGRGRPGAAGDGQVVLGRFREPAERGRRRRVPQRRRAAGRERRRAHRAHRHAARVRAC